MEKGRTPPQQIISSCLFYYFHCFLTFRATKTDRKQKEKKNPFWPMFNCCMPLSWNRKQTFPESVEFKQMNWPAPAWELNRSSRNNSSGWLDESLHLLCSTARIFCLSLWIQGPYSYLYSAPQAFSWPKVAVHDPPGSQCSQLPLFSRWNISLNICSGSPGFDQTDAGLEVNRDEKHLTVPFLPFRKGKLA